MFNRFKYNTLYHKRCRVLCCCIWADENRKGAFDEIADMLTKFFKVRIYAEIAKLRWLNFIVMFKFQQFILYFCPYIYQE